MSAKRISLLAAAIVSGVLTPTAPCWAQAYGAASLVEHNDLRWFEPIELDLDGQMPRRDDGFFFTADKLWWSVGVNKTEIGSPGLIVDSEVIFPSTPVPIAISALEQIEGFDFIEDAAEAVAFGGISFATFDTNGTDFLRDDTEQVLSLRPVGTATTTNANNLLNFAFRNSAAYNRVVAAPTAADPAATRMVTRIESVGDLQAALEQVEQGFPLLEADGVTPIDGDPVEAAQDVRVAGTPKPYGVQNSIRDALPDAGFSWGERFEFGHMHDGRGWSVTILDGPESVAGGIFGAGEGAPYFSQTNDEFYGADRFFLGDLEDDLLDGEGDGDGEQGAVDIFALGFGSVAVNFELPNEDFLTGFRDYNNGNSPFTTSGPIMYVGNYGSTFTELIVQALNLQGGAPSLGDVNAAFGAAVGTNFDTGTLAVLNSSLITFAAANGNLTAQVAEVQNVIGILDAGVFPAGGFADAAAAQAGLTTAFGTLTTAATALGATAGGVVGGGGANQAVGVNNIDREADDINGNGNPGVISVIGTVNGVQTVVGQIIDTGDLHTFNVFFDEVTVRNTTEVDGVELMRMYELSTSHKMQQGRWDGLRISYGVRFLNIEDDFYFQGLGSILGRTTVSTDVENQVVGPQIGMQWIRRDGPWDFLLEARGTAGYNIVDVDQNAVFGTELIPGALNRPATARTTTSVDGTRFDEFSPLGELRAQLRYRVADAITLQAGYTAKFVGNVHRGGDATAWRAPDFGINNNAGDIFINGLNFGIELRH